MFLLEILKIILYFSALIITIIILSIILPLTLSLQSTVDGTEYSGAIKLRILLNLINGNIKFDADRSKFSLRLASLQVYESKQKTSLKKTEEKTETAKEKRRNPLKMAEPLTILLKSILEKIKIKKIDIYLNAGIDDPYSNGVIFGLIYPIIEIIRLRFQKTSIIIQPEFIDEKFYADLDGKISLRIILMIIPLLRFYFSKEFREYKKSR